MIHRLTASFCRQTLVGMAVVCALILVGGESRAQGWAKLRSDGVHDVRSPAINFLQEPSDALAPIAAKAPDVGVGAGVRWVKALDEGVIKPRTNILDNTPIRILDQDIYLNIGGGMPIVRFPHREHTVWLDCSNCHDKLFPARTGATTFAMLTILEGEQCGVCHGAVAFPLTECLRCHTVPQKDFPALEKRLGLVRFGEKGLAATRQGVGSGQR